MSALRLEQVSKSFGGVTAVAEVSFAVAPRQIFALIGPNGAGKTTLFNLISGVYRPSAGRVFLSGEDVTGQPPHLLARHGLARTFQTPQVFLNMSAVENVMVGAHRHLRSGLLPAIARLGRFRAAEKACRADAAALMERLGLGRYRDAEAGSLPYGALKRLEVARAMASKPRLLLLDEPAAGLNAGEAEEMVGVLRAIAETGVTVVLIEHNMRMVMGISERVLVLVSGRVLVEGAPADVQRHPEVVAAYLGAEAAPSEERRRA
ncbi:MAG: ABC transporter ATP-binding protein [Candidatus Odyssella sp.]|nr:ABC transporter ATP-binding protein [Candidatus Odyssella sp.]